jgi:threonine dehydrogenase-like Zn-dependent dehydrogenase
MGLGAVDYALHCDRRPGLIVVTDIDESRLSRAASLLTPESAAGSGIKLVYLKTSAGENALQQLLEISGNSGYDDVMVFAASEEVIGQGDAILAFDGCLNFFAGPLNHDFHASLNFYNVHYSSTHIVGTSGGNTEDMKEALDLMKEERLDPAIMITHVGGLDAVAETTLNLPYIPGGKKLIYTNISMPLVSLSELNKHAKSNPLFAGLHEIVAGNNYKWSAEAERYLLSKASPI